MELWLFMNIKEMLQKKFFLLLANILPHTTIVSVAFFGGGKPFWL
jgi:hypothetical protein